MVKKLKKGEANDDLFRKCMFRIFRNRKKKIFLESNP